jgi:hypothetical protein
MSHLSLEKEPIRIVGGTAFAFERPSLRDSVLPDVSTPLVYHAGHRIAMGFRPESGPSFLLDGPVRPRYDI